MLYEDVLFFEPSRPIHSRVRSRRLRAQTRGVSMYITTTGLRVIDKERLGRPILGYVLAVLDETGWVTVLSKAGKTMQFTPGKLGEMGYEIESVHEPHPES